MARLGYVAMTLAQLKAVVARAPDEVRMCEPVTFGLPCPAGAVLDPSTLILHDDHGLALPLQCAALDRWPADGSVRWALIDSQLSAPSEYTVSANGGETTAHPDPLTVSAAQDGYSLSTAACQYEVTAGSAALFARVTPDGRRRAVRLELMSAAKGAGRVRFARATAETLGPLRTTLRVEGTVGLRRSASLRVVARLSWFAGLADVRVEITLHNPHRARHAGGYWELGDPGSISFRDASLVVECAGDDDVVTLSESLEQALTDVASPVLLFQESSGGDSWSSRVHVNLRGEVPLRFRGYCIRTPGVERRGSRADPVLARNAGDEYTAIAVREFWQNFPKALEASGARLRIGLFPREAVDLHELQGGEQKTHVVGISWRPATVSTRPLDWIARPTIVSATPRYYAEVSAIPYLSPSTDGDRRYESLLETVLDGPDSFARKREHIDEYGWRHFGEIYADHEAVFARTGADTISHYNNQYDAVNGFAIQFMRSADPRWWTAMDELARHVTDIDIYRTTEDKSAYNGGLFWHTYHYKDAARSTHRSYPRAEGVAGGGPSNEHDYSTGLMHYYFLTGNAWARDSVLTLADWVIGMDDGARTVFRWLSLGETGLASATASETYHGPGRGAGNSITTLLNAFRLTGRHAYLSKAEALLRRCVHPSDDVAGRNLLDAERRWSYTVFLQALGRYLDDKQNLGQLDSMYAYARAALLRYVRWMDGHEYPYLERPEILEYPTETWAAQDMRKCDVFLFAERHAEPADASRFRVRAAYFHDAALEFLLRFDSRTLARPRVLLLSYGFMLSTATSRGLEPAAVPRIDYQAGPPQSFVPQKQIAFARARRLAIVLAIALIVAVTAVVTTHWVTRP